ncbi:hypothetical protein C4566_00560 [Candidatus Parcubacteria bacterium]|nr:MAG: hypothetical protein C4566_00560 [Candidatus Parcubacteria bacterium]
MADPAGEERDLVAVEAEERRATPLAIGSRIELVARTVDPEIVVMLETLGVGEQHNGDLVGTETELVGGEDLASPADGTSTVTETELSRNEQDVVLRLLVTDEIQRVVGANGSPQVLGTELTMAIVVELAATGLLDQIENDLHSFAVGRCDLLPPRDGEPALGTTRQNLAGDILVHPHRDVGEELAQDLALLGDRPDHVVRQVAVLGGDLLVGVLVGNRELPDGRDDASLELPASADELLDAILVQVRFLKRPFGRVFDETLVLLDLTGRDRRVGRHRRTSS